MTHETEREELPQAPLARETLPKHVAIIMDGNGRWARRQLKPRIWGHRKGADRVREIVQAAGETGIKALTLFAFSEENWGRPEQEVNALMGLIDFYLLKERNELHSNNVRFRILGSLDRLPAKTKRLVDETIKLTASNSGLQLNVALSYGSRTELAEACRKIAECVRRGEIEPAEIDQDLVSHFLQTRELPELDFLIRTSGELRLSNFLLWQAAYAELYFTPVQWPDFTRERFLEALQVYQLRQRRFGRVVAEEQTPVVDEAARAGASAAYYVDAVDGPLDSQICFGSES